MFSIRRKYGALVLLFFLFLVNGFAQEFKSDEDRRKHAEKLFEQEKYIEAAPHFLHFLSLNPRDHELNYKYGACLVYYAKDKTEPLKYLQYAVKNDAVDPLAHYFLGKTYQQSFRFSAAIKEFEIYGIYTNFRYKEKYQISNEIRACNNGKELLKNFSEIVVISKKNVKKDKFQYSYDLSSIGGKIIITDQFNSKFDKKKDHKAVVYFPKNNNEYIFFSSYGADGLMEKDLYRVKRLDGGKFSEPEKLPLNINTKFDEDYAFLHPDGKTFYFSSKGHNSMGGYDIFKSEYDAATNTFTDPENLDFKINTPADDFFYIVDESGKYAHFSSNRASQGGYLDVYHIRNKTIPYSNVYIVGQFINYIDDNLSVSIKVEDAITKSIVGIYETKPESGAYMVKLPQKGNFNYYVELNGNNRVYTGSINIPSDASMMLKQEILLEEIASNEELIIKNLFDEEIPNSEELMANMFMEISDLKENSENFDESMLDGQLSEDLMAQFGIDVATATEQELLNVVDEIIAKTEKSTQNKKQLIENAYKIADEKTRESKRYKNEAERLKALADQETDTVQKNLLIKQINDAEKRQNINSQQALFAINYAKDLESKLDQSEENLKKVEELASQVQESIISQDKESAVKTLRSMQQIAKNEEVTVTDDSAISAVINVQSEEVDEEYRSKKSKLDKVLENEDVIKQEIKALERRKEEAKKSDKDFIQLQIDDANETLEINKKQKEKYEEELAEAREKQKLVKEKQSEIKSVIDEITSGKIAQKEHTEYEKQEIEIEAKQIAGENVDNLIANRIDSGPKNKKQSNISSIDKEAYAELEEKYEETFTIKDEKEKINSQQSINKTYVDKLSNDIKKLENELPNASNKNEIEEEIKGLYQLKKNKEAELKNQNNKLYKLAEEETKKSISTQEYIALDNKHKVLSTKIKKESDLDSLREVNNQIVSVSDKDLASLKQKLSQSDDPIEQEVIKKSIQEIEEIKTKKEQENIALEADNSTIKSIEDVFSDEPFEKINNEIQAEKSSLNPIQENLNLAQKGLELTNKNIKLIDEKLSEVKTAETKSILINRKKALNQKKKQYQSVAEQANNLLAEQNNNTSNSEQKNTEKTQQNDLAENNSSNEGSSEKNDQNSNANNENSSQKSSDEDNNEQESSSNNKAGDVIQNTKNNTEDTSKEELTENQSTSKTKTEKTTQEIEKEERQKAFEVAVNQKEKQYKSFDDKINASTSAKEKIEHRENFIDEVKDEKLTLNKQLSLSEDEDEKTKIRKRIEQINSLEEQQSKQVEIEKEEQIITKTKQLLAETTNDSKYQAEINTIEEIENKTYTNELERLSDKKSTQQSYLSKVENDILELNKSRNSISDNEIKQEISEEISRLEQKKQTLKREINEIEKAVEENPSNQYVLAQKVTYSNSESKQKYEASSDKRNEVIQLKEKENGLLAESIEDPENKKLQKTIEKTKQERIEAENELISSYKAVNSNEINQLKDEITTVKTALKEQNASEEQLAKIEAIEEKAKTLSQEAATLRYQTTIVKDEELNNIKLNRAYEAEVEAIQELNKAKNSYNELAQEIDVDTKKLELGKIISENDTDVSIVAQNSEFKSEEAKESFKKNQTIIEEINALDEKINEINQNDFLTTEENKALEKLEVEKAEKEVQLSKGLSEANQIEYKSNKANQLTIKQDLNDFNINEELTAYKAETEKEENLVSRLYKEADDIRAVAEKTEDLEEKKQLYKQANIKERIAILKQQDIIESYGEILTQNLLIEKETVKIEANHNLSNTQYQKANKLENEAVELQQNLPAIKDSLIAIGLDEENISQRVKQIERQAEIKSELARKVKDNAREIELEENKEIELNNVISKLTDEEIKASKSEKAYRKHYFLSQQKEEQESELKALKIQLAKEEIQQQKLINKGEQYEFEANVTSNSDMKNDLLQKAAETKELSQVSSNKVDSLRAVIQVMESNISNTESQVLSNLNSTPKAQEMKAIYEKVADNKPIVETKQEIAEENTDQNSKIEPETSVSTEEKSSTSDKEKEALTQNNESKSTTTKIDYSKPIDVKSFVVPEKIDQPIFTKTTTKKSVYSDDVPMPINATPKEGLVFRVQIGAFTKPVSNDAFKGFAPISGEKIPGSKWTRYMAGYFTNFDLADNAKTEIRKINGYSDAFVVAFYNGKKISISEARRIYAEGDANQLVDKNELDMPEVLKEENSSNQEASDDTSLTEDNQTEETQEETLASEQNNVSKNIDNQDNQNNIDEAKNNSVVTKIEQDTTKKKITNSDLEEKLKSGEPVNFNDLQNAETNPINFVREVEQTPSGLLVTLKINTRVQGGFAKIEEVIPPDFKVELLTINGALTAQEVDTLKFVWEDYTNEDLELRYALYPPKTAKTGIYRVYGGFTPEFAKEASTFTYFRYIASENNATNDSTVVETGTNEGEDKSPKITSITKDKTVEELTIDDVTNVELDAEKASYYKDAGDAAKAEQVEVIKGLFFTVQIGVYSKPVPSSSLFNIKPLNTELIRSGLIRYTTGQFTSLDDASLRKDEIRLVGVKDAFVTAYFNGERITIAKAKQLIDKFGDEVLIKK